MAPAYSDRQSRARSVSRLSDSNYESATDQKLYHYARVYGIDTSKWESYRNERSQSMVSDYSEVASKRLSRISEDYNYASSVAEDDEYNGTTGALVPYSGSALRARSVTPTLDVTNYSNQQSSQQFERSCAISDSSAISDCMGYTRNVISSFPYGGNVKVHFRYRPIPRIYNYSPVHKHYHVNAPNHYHVSQAAPEKEAYTAPPAVYHHHHYHYPKGVTTEKTVRKYYLPMTSMISASSGAAETTTSSREYSSSEMASRALEQRASSYAKESTAEREMSTVSDRYGYGSSSARAALEY